MHSKLTAILRSYEHDLAGFTATILAIAMALGFIGAAFAGLELRSFLDASPHVNFGLVVVFTAVVFAAVWCSQDGPPRWRPIVLSDRRLKSMSASVLHTLIGIGAVALVINSHL
ncbi:MAG: hypothetical protein JO258_15005 [Alphaproteobacteria bacterium]|nr:hypothetical protein [Alphaproteobacteria bacterium]